jgi:hypothetical protein
MLAGGGKRNFDLPSFLPGPFGDGRFQAFGVVGFD